MTEDDLKVIDARDACIEIAEVVAAALGKPSPLK